MMNLVCRRVGAWSLNTYVLTCSATRQSVLVDPGAEPDTLQKMVEGTRPKAILITHSHPDHYFSAPVFVQAFPNVELITIPKVCLNIGISIPGRLKYWSPILGSNTPRYPVIPKPYYESFIELEGEKLEILGPINGDHKESTAIYIRCLLVEQRAEYPNQTR